MHPTGFAESQAPPQPPTAAVKCARGRPTSARRRERQRGGRLLPGPSLRPSRVGFVYSRPDPRRAGRLRGAANPLAMGFVVIRVRGRSGLGAVMSCVAANELLPQRGPLFRAAPAPFRLAFGVQVLGRRTSREKARHNHQVSSNAGHLPGEPQSISINQSKTKKAVRFSKVWCPLAQNRYRLARTPKHTPSGVCLRLLPNPAHDLTLTRNPTR